jgi:hypothetical protein
MKKKNLMAYISKFDLVGGIHYFVSFQPFTPRLGKKFNHYKDARKYALRHVYVKNLNSYC